MPTARPRVASTAAVTPGSMTPSMGTFTERRKDAKATAEAVLQATIKSLTPLRSRNRATPMEYRATASGDFEP